MRAFKGRKSGDMLEFWNGGINTALQVKQFIIFDVKKDKL